MNRARSVLAGVAVSATVSLALVPPASADRLVPPARASLVQVSHDIYTDAQAQHKTEVEPDVFSFGSTIVSAFQVGRVFGGGSSNIGWATSTNGGATWTHGFLPGITGNAGGPFGQASDASVAYDAKASVWLIASLGLGASSVAVLVSRSANGGTAWGRPITIAGGATDKDWIVCDNTPSSPHYGNCYAEYDIPGNGDSVRVQTSTDGGATWGPAQGPVGGARGIGGQPLVLPDGHVVVPYEGFAAGIGSIRVFRSTDGGASWSATALISSISHHIAAGSLRAPPLPSAAVGAAGTVYVAWPDCRFRAGCASNDIVLAKSTSETTWAAPFRVPIDAATSTADHFVPGIAVDPATSGSTARLGLTYYYYPDASCTAATCRLDAGFISSVNGGTSWSAPTMLAGPQPLSWLPGTAKGIMFGDYVATTVLSGGNAYPVLPVARAPSGSAFSQAMYAPVGGLPLTGGSRPAATSLPNAARGANSSVR